MPAFDSSNYSYSNITVAMLGNASVANIKSVKYSVERKRENHFGTSEDPVNFGTGVREYSGEIILSLGEVKKIRAAIGGKSLLDVPPFTMSVSYANGSDPITTDVLIGCTFDKDETSGATGDTEMKVTIPVGLLKIEYGS